jgi:hypothetical protein
MVRILIATSAHLLEWRDDLIEAGWDGLAPLEGIGRMLDLAAI